MKALVLEQLKQPLRLVEKEDLVPAAGEVIVRLAAAALNRRDYWITQGMYPGVKTPVTLGSDGAGVVRRLGPGVDASWLDQDVIVNPGWAWGNNSRAQGESFRILGMPDEGTFAEEVRAPAVYLAPRPAHLDWHEAAALPLAGVTAYRAVFTQGRLKHGERVLVSGIGGGVATFALQMARAAGAEVWVTSSSQHKIEKARQLGAQAGYDYRVDGWSKRLLAEHGPMDLLIDSAGGNGHAALIELAAPGGRIVNYGATAGPPKQLDLFKLFWKQLHLIGSTMGSPADFQNMVEFVNQHQLRPAIDGVFSLDEGNQALKRMSDCEQFGKLVLEVDAHRSPSS